MAEKHICGIYDPFHDRAGNKRNSRQICFYVHVGRGGAILYSPGGLFWYGISCEKDVWKWKMVSLEDFDGEPLSYKNMTKILIEFNKIV